MKGACQQATAEHIQALQQNFLTAESIVQAALSNDSLHQQLQTHHSLKLLDLNYEFHRLIAEGSQNPWLIFLLDQLAN